MHRRKSWITSPTVTVRVGKWEIKDSNYKNHRMFTLRSISKALIPVSVRLKSTSNSSSRRSREIIHTAEKQLHQDSIKCINGILCKNAITLDRWRSRLLSMVTTTMDKCTEFINKVRESRFIKIRNRQINKFNRLMGKRDTEVSKQPLASNNQSQAPTNPINVL